MSKLGRALLFVAIATVASVGRAEVSWDTERLNLELSMQKRVEQALSKILADSDFVVVIHIDPLTNIGESRPAAKAPAQRSSSDFYLPGVPAKKTYNGSSEQMQDLVDTLKPDGRTFQRFIRRISATLVLDESLKDEEVNRVRELTRQMLGLDATRGDTLDIQKSAFGRSGLELNEGGMLKFQKGLRNYWLLISVSLLLFCVAVFFLFMFGPLRGFLNQSVQVLSTLKPIESPTGSRMGADMQMLPALMAQQGFALPGPMAGGGISPASFSGSLQVENPNRKTLPFGFVREDHVSNLALLLSRETPEKAAVVLGYLPPDWISRVLSKMELSMQAEVASHLATPRQLLPEQVEDIEQDLKRRLDYLVGGPDRLTAIYESLDPDSQRRMLENLRETRPDLADDLRSRTWLFEDLEKLESAALKSLLREIDMQTLVQSMKGVPDSFKARVLESVSEGKAEIIREELELSENSAPGKATFEAQKKVVLIARRLEREGQIQVPQQIGDATPAARYPSLKSSLKLPPALKGGNGASEAKDAEVVQPKSAVDFQEKMRQFMKNKDRGDSPK